MLPEAKIFARFPDGTEEQNLPLHMQRLLEQQKAVWPACGKGFAALEQAEVRTLNVAGFTARLQWNPQRIVSTGAKVDASSIRSRQCFLCVENLPSEQRGILYGSDYLVLCNPSPIFPAHYTVTHIEHRAQNISHGIASLLSLTRDMGQEYVAFYNGPRCGASAPDHLHFQVVASGSIPAEADVHTAAKRDRITEADGITIWKIPFYGRTHCILSGSDPDALAGMFRRVLAAWQSVLALTEEPMLNLVSLIQGGEMSLLMFLRRKHRPDDYFKDGDERVLVSPASVDMGGHVVTPIEKDFHAIDGPYVEHMYTEVSETPAVLGEIMHAL